MRRLALSRLISLAGTDASAVAVSFGIYRATGSVAWLSASLFVMFGLGSAAAPLAGVIADRRDRWRVMLGADLVAAATFTVLALEHSPVATITLSALATVAGTVHGAAAAAAIASRAAPEDLSRANGIVATGANVGKTVGRLAGGLLVAALGVGAVFALDALTFLVSGALAWSARPARGTAAAPRTAPRSRVREGWSALAGDPRLRLVVASSCLATFMTSLTMTAEAPLVTELGVGAAGLGALAASWSVGMIGGSSAAAWVLRADREAAGLLAGRLLMGAAIGCVALTPVFWPALLCYVVGGAAGGFLLVAASSIVQRAVADEVLGRVTATAEGLKTAAFGAGVVCAGAIVGLLGPQGTFGLVGAGVVLSAWPLLRLVRLHAASPTPALART